MGWAAIDPQQLPGQHHRQRGPSSGDEETQHTFKVLADEIRRSKEKTNSDQALPSAWRK